jgi:hypothetical protein
MFAIGEDRNAKKKKAAADDDKDDGSSSDGASKSIRPSDLGSSMPATPKAASGSASTTDGTQPIKQVSQTDATSTNAGATNPAATKTGAVKPAVAETDDDDSKSTDPPSSRWSFWQLFKFGGADVSGNKEP